LSTQIKKSAYCSNYDRLKSISRMTAAIVVLFSLNASAFSEDKVARIYELGHVTGAPIFTQKTHVESKDDGNFHHTSSIADAKGVEVMTETAVFHGSRLISQKVDQLQSHESVDVDVAGEKVTYKTYSILKDGTRHLEKTNVTDAKSDFIAGPTSESFLREHWDELVSGKTVQSDFSIPEFSKPIGFEFKKKPDEEISGKKALVIKMSPSSFFISLVADPMELSFDLTSKRIVRYRGRTPMKKMTGDKAKAFDAEILYDYPEVSPSGEKKP
jgi:hypothetical protein